MSWKNAISEFVPPSPQKDGSSFGRRSRLQQQLQQLRRQKSKLQALREQRERDFCLYFNIPDARQLHGPESAKRRPTVASPATAAIRSVSAPSMDRARKVWTTSKKFEIRAESGEVFSFSPTQYSSDELDMDGENADGRDSAVSGPAEHCTHSGGENMVHDGGIGDADTDSEKGFYTCHSKTSTSSVTLLSSPSPSHVLEYLQIEVFSNWGDEDLVGISHLELRLESPETPLLPINDVQLYRSSPLNGDAVSHKIANATEELHLFCTQNALPLTVPGVRECRLTVVRPQAQSCVLFEGELQKAREHSEEGDFTCFRFPLQTAGEEAFQEAKSLGELATNVLQCLEETFEFSFA
ncbi:unnamed protein product, partial [Dibothriocephalus latus]